MLYDVEVAYRAPPTSGRTGATSAFRPRQRPDGAVGKMRIKVKPFGLDEAAIRAARRFRFVPGTRLGGAGRGAHDHRVRLHLAMKAPDRRGPSRRARGRGGLGRPRPRPGRLSGLRPPARWRASATGRATTDSGGGNGVRHFARHPIELGDQRWRGQVAPLRGDPAGPWRPPGGFEEGLGPARERGGESCALGVAACGRWAAAVRGSKHVVTKGATPVLSPAEARKRRPLTPLRRGGRARRTTCAPRSRRLRRAARRR